MRFYDAWGLCLQSTVRLWGLRPAANPFPARAGFRFEAHRRLPSVPAPGDLIAWWGTADGPTLHYYHNGLSQWDWHYVGRPPTDGDDRCQWRLDSEEGTGSFWHALPSTPAEKGLVVISRLVPHFLRISGQLCLHGVLLGGDDQAVVVAGDSGRGKSTLALACLRAGVPVLADDLARVVDPGGAPTVPPGGTFVRTTEELVASVLGEVPADRLIAPLAGEWSGGKRLLDTSDEPFWNDAEPLALGAVVVLGEYGTAAIPRLERVGPREAPHLLFHHISQPHTRVPASVRKGEFRASAALAQRVPVYRLHRPHGLSHLAETVDLIETDLLSVAAP